MSQKELIIAWCKEFGEITPAKMAGRIYLGIMFGSETSKRCRELRKDRILLSRREEKFEIFWLKDDSKSPKEEEEPVPGKVESGIQVPLRETQTLEV